MLPENATANMITASTPSPARHGAEVAGLAAAEQRLDRRRRCRPRPGSAASRPRTPACRRRRTGRARPAAPATAPDRCWWPGRWPRTPRRTSGRSAAGPGRTSSRSPTGRRRGRWRRGTEVARRPEVTGRGRGCRRWFRERRREPVRRCRRLLGRRLRRLGGPRVRGRASAGSASVGRFGRVPLGRRGRVGRVRVELLGGLFVGREVQRAGRGPGSVQLRRAPLGVLVVNGLVDVLGLVTRRYGLVVGRLLVHVTILTRRGAEPPQASTLTRP